MAIIDQQANLTIGVISYNTMILINYLWYDWWDYVAICMCFICNYFMLLSIVQTWNIRGYERSFNSFRITRSKPRKILSVYSSSNSSIDSSDACLNSFSENVLLKLSCLLNTSDCVLLSISVTCCLNNEPHLLRKFI